MSNDLDQQCIDTLRILSVDLVQKADSGHPGVPLGAAPSGRPGWPLLAFCTMSTDRKRSVSMHCWSRVSDMGVLQ
jgi:hypothetical protein